eukprot:3900252-Pyramimonas_sp.AAC.1
MSVAPSAWQSPMLTPKLTTAGGTLMAMVRTRPPKPRCKAAACWGGRRVACGHVDPGMHLADELAEKRCLTGRAPMGAGRSCVVSATH